MTITEAVAELKNAAAALESFDAESAKLLDALVARSDLSVGLRKQAVRILRARCIEALRNITRKPVVVEASE